MDAEQVALLAEVLAITAFWMGFLGFGAVMVLKLCAGMVSSLWRRRGGARPFEERVRRVAEMRRRNARVLERLEQRMSR